MQKAGGTEALDEPYLDTRIGKMIRKLAGWLSILLVGEVLTATVITFFGREIARAVVLVLFIPLVISSGGNSGSQAATLVISAMAVGEVPLRKWWKAPRREVPAGLVLGSVLCGIGLSRMLLWDGISGAYGGQVTRIGLTVGVSLIGVLLFGTVAGGMLPILVRVCRLEPASALAPAVATLVDVSALVIYFSFARALMLGGALR